jgi:hypothetical protein
MKTGLIKITLCFLLILTGCVKSGSSEDGVGTISIRLTDAPFPTDLIAEANVTIYKIEARTIGDEDYEEEYDNENGQGGEGEEENAYLLLMEEEITVNLLDLTNGVTENLVNAEIPSGVYDRFRVYVKGVNVVMNDEANTTFDLKVPSGEQSGIKIMIKPPLVVTNGLSADLLFDFDVCKSFVPRGNIKNPENFNGFNFKPVIKVSNLTTTGTAFGAISTLEGESAIPVGGAQVSVLQNGEEIRTTFSDDSGGYMIMGLEAGSYDISVDANGFLGQTAENVLVDAGNRTKVDFEISPE